MSNVILPSLNFSEAGKTLWPVVVIGAGPAGAMTAHQLARAGMRVLLIDKAAFPRDKVCGCCLNRVALRALEHAGMKNIVERRTSRIHSFSLHLGRNSAAVDLIDGVAISRSALDAAMVNEAVNAGAHFLPNTQASVLPQEAGITRTALIMSTSGEESRIEAQIIIIADGLGGTSLQYMKEFDAVVSDNSLIGAGTIVSCDSQDYHEGTIYMAVGKHGYVGIVRIEDGRLDVAAALEKEAVKEAKSPAALACDILGSAHLPEVKELLHAKWHGTVPLTRRRRRLAGHRLLVIGDAALYIEPFTGEGISWALRCGLAVSKMIAKELEINSAECWNPHMVSAWSRMHRQLIENREQPTRILAAALRRPKILACALAAVNHFPWLSKPVLTYMDGVCDV